MNDYVLSCCSTADLDLKYFETHDVSYICYHYTLNGITFSDDMGKTLPFDEFYKLMAQGAETHTTQINAEEFYNYFKPMLEQGKDILHVCLSSGLTGVANSAFMAREQLLEEFPDRQIYIVDSLCASSGYGLLIDAMNELKQNGYGIKELYDWAEENKLHVHHWFFSTDLDYYVKGGRISKASGFFGNALKICPVLNVNKNGMLIVREKIRTKTKAMKVVIEKMEEHATDGINYNGKCFICHSDSYDDALALKSQIEEKFINLKEPVSIYNIGTTIGSHTGPGTISVFFWGDLRND